MAAIPLHVQHVRALPDHVPSEAVQEIMQSHTLTHDHMLTYRLDVPTLHALGVNFRHLLWHWGEPPAAANLVWGRMNSKAVLEDLKFALTQRAVASRFPALDWFSIGLTVHDMLALGMHDVDTLAVFRVSIDKLLAHKAYELGETWARETRWTALDYRRLGFDKARYEKFLDDEERKNAHFPRALAEAFAPRDGLRLAVPRAPRRAGSIFDTARAAEAPPPPAPAPSRLPRWVLAVWPVGR